MPNDDNNVLFIGFGEGEMKRNTPCLVHGKHSLNDGSHTLLYFSVAVHVFFPCYDKVAKAE